MSDIWADIFKAEILHDILEKGLKNEPGSIWNVGWSDAGDLLVEHTTDLNGTKEISVLKIHVTRLV